MATGTEKTPETTVKNVGEKRESFTRVYVAQPDSYSATTNSAAKGLIKCVAHRESEVLRELERLEPSESGVYVVEIERIKVALKEMSGQHKRRPQGQNKRGQEGNNTSLQSSKTNSEYG